MAESTEWNEFKQLNETEDIQFIQAWFNSISVSLPPLNNRQYYNNSILNWISSHHSSNCGNQNFIHDWMSSVSEFSLDWLTAMDELIRLLMKLGYSLANGLIQPIKLTSVWFSFINLLKFINSDWWMLSDFWLSWLAGFIYLVDWLKTFNPTTIKLKQSSFNQQQARNKSKLTKNWWNEWINEFQQWIS